MSTPTVAAAALLASLSLASAQAPGPAQILPVREFGAIAGDGSDAGPGIRAALAEAVKRGPGTQVVLEAGVYRVGPTANEHAVIPIHGARGITLKGQGLATEIRVTAPDHAAIMLMGCTKVAIEDLVIDYEPLPFTQGVIRQTDPAAGWFDLAIEAGYPSPAEPQFAQAPRPFGRWGMIFPPDQRRLKTGAPDFVFIERWEEQEAGLWRFFAVEDQRDRVRQMEPGDRFAHMARQGAGSVFFADSRDCSARRVTLYASPALGFGASNSDRVTVDGCVITWRPDTTRLLSANADGVHCQRNLRGPVIQGCTFEGMADDAVNLYYYPNTITQVESPTTVVASGAGLVEVGDLVQVFDPARGLLRGTARVVSTAPAERAGWVRLTWDRPVAGMVAGLPQGAVEKGGTFEGDNLFNLSRCGRGFIIRGNTFRMHRRFAMMIKTPGGLIEGNTIEAVGAYAMVVGNEPHWPEGIAPNDIVIRGNTITNIGYSMGYPDSPSAAAIQIHTLAKRGLAEDRVVQGITIEGNTFTNPPGAAVFVGSASEVMIADNDVVYTPAARLTHPTAAVEIARSAGVRIRGLRLTAGHESVTAAIHVDAQTDPGVLGLQHADVEISGRPVEILRDERPPP
jgi:hypothetical protein